MPWSTNSGMDLLNINFLLRAEKQIQVNNISFQFQQTQCTLTLQAVFQTVFILFSLPK